ncbi:hypothetical protein RDG78_004172 [Vibrio vulnificus]|nr:hypothetical protein [Vibrio vulnificus]MDS1833198.1 hypothetical protein [Vibrio vulnificus]
MMHSVSFKASVQYDDWKGTCAADDADQTRISTWLKDNGHMEKSEFLVGVKMYVGENDGEHNDPVSVTFMILPLVAGETVEEKIASAQGPVGVKVVRLDMNAHEFLAFFKRFNVAFSRCKAFDGCEYVEI